MHHGADEEAGTDEKDGECCKGPADRKHHGALIVHLDRRATTMPKENKRVMSKKKDDRGGRRWGRVWHVETPSFLNNGSAPP